ncbi:hypothetical protein QYE76_035493 [Lolium multiflorum]|uniref:Retrotransposon Copia-like N-terminal domain-containing protein n=1 Tax=Lolium multiflorum TaxID=4521 RepID=A0AAD8QZ53_LOLMU|nr:hypothetical protein QYE76_035493 [Lolium multiflorum]
MATDGTLSPPSTIGALSSSTTGAISAPSSLGALSASTISASTLSSMGTLPAGSMFSSAGFGGASSSTTAVAAPFHFGNLLTVKLGSDNYLLWRSAILPLLRSHFLMGYVDGTYPCPPERVLVQFEGRPAAIPNPEHQAWVMQDQALLSGINSSLTPAVGGLVMFAATAQEAWVTLRDSFDTHFSAQSVHIRGQLQKMEKQTSSITTYFNKIKALSDSLTAMGQPLAQEDFVAYVLNGLDEDYDNLAENINGRETPISTRELHARLLSTEQRVESRRAAALQSGASANAAYRGGGRGTPRPHTGGSGGATPSPTTLPLATLVVVVGRRRPLVSVVAVVRRRPLICPTPTTPPVPTTEGAGVEAGAAGIHPMGIVHCASFATRLVTSRRVAGSALTRTSSV